MKKRLGFLHAHYSNITYIEHALAPYKIECVHFVNPTLIQQMNSQGGYTLEQARNILHEQIASLAFSNVDAIVVTCTNYSSILQQDKVDVTIPIFKIDDPFFEYVTTLQLPLTLLFSNAATVEGTVANLKNYLNLHNKTLDYEVQIVPDSFDLVMQGLTEQYNHLIADYLHTSYDSTRVIAVAQLSMVNGAKKFEKETSFTVINALDTLVPTLLTRLAIQL